MALRMARESLVLLQNKNNILPLNTHLKVAVMGLSLIHIFSTTNPENVKKNIAFIEEPIDWELVREVQEIIGEQKRVSWANS